MDANMKLGAHLVVCHSLLACQGWRIGARVSLGSKSLELWVLSHLLMRYCLYVYTWIYHLRNVVWLRNTNLEILSLGWAGNMWRESYFNHVDNHLVCLLSWHASTQPSLTYNRISLSQCLNWSGCMKKTWLHQLLAIILETKLLCVHWPSASGQSLIVCSYRKSWSYQCRRLGLLSTVIFNQSIIKLELWPEKSVWCLLYLETNRNMCDLKSSPFLWFNSVTQKWQLIRI